MGFSSLYVNFESNQVLAVILISFKTRFIHKPACIANVNVIILAN